MKHTVKLQVNNLGKSFFYRWIFSGISAHWQTGDIVGITGRNGAGKSTLLKIIAGIFAPSQGTISVQLDGKELYPDRLHPHLGFVAPYLHLYTELTPWEHLRLAARLRGISFEPEAAEKWLEHFSIATVAHRPLATFSSGMLQRFRLVLALAHHPPLLCLDEPGATLDHQGSKQLQAAIQQCAPHSLILIASNDPADLVHCTHTLAIEQYHSGARIDPLSA